MEEEEGEQKEQEQRQEQEEADDDYGNADPRSALARPWPPSSWRSWPARLSKIYSLETRPLGSARVGA
eukprot:9470399-Pyramimonas_sp.AAC.2